MVTLEAVVKANGGLVGADTHGSSYNLASIIAIKSHVTRGFSKNSGEEREAAGRADSQRKLWSSVCPMPAVRGTRWPGIGQTLDTLGKHWTPIFRLSGRVSSVHIPRSCLPAKYGIKFNLLNLLVLVKFTCKLRVNTQC